MPPKLRSPLLAHMSVAISVGLLDGPRLIERVAYPPPGIREVSVLSKSADSGRVVGISGQSLPIFRVSLACALR
jgi:hypothetical protein